MPGKRRVVSRCKKGVLGFITHLPGPVINTLVEARKGLLGLWFTGMFITVRKTRRLELEATLSIAFMIKKQRKVSAAPRFTFSSSFSPEPQLIQWGHPR